MFPLWCLNTLKVSTVRMKERGKENKGERIMRREQVSEGTDNELKDSEEIRVETK